MTHEFIITADLVRKYAEALTPVLLTLIETDGDIYYDGDHYYCDEDYCDYCDDVLADNAKMHAEAMCALTSIFPVKG